MALKTNDKGIIDVVEGFAHSEVRDVLIVRALSRVHKSTFIMQIYNFQMYEVFASVNPSKTPLMTGSDTSANPNSIPNGQ